MKAVLETKLDLDSRHVVLTILSLIAFLIFFQSYLLAPLVPSLSKEFHVSDSFAGLLVPAYMIPYGISSLFYGPLSDRFGRRRIFLIVFFLTIITIIGGAFSESIYIFLFWRIAGGIVMGGVIPIAIALIGDLFPYNERGSAMGWIFGAMAGGSAVGSTAGALFNSTIGWRNEFLGAASVAGVVLWIVFHYRTLLSDQKSHSSSLRDTFLSYSTLIQSSRGKRTYAYIFLNGAFHSGVFTWLGLYFMRRHGLQEEGVGLALLGYGVPGMLLGPMIGLAVDRVGRNILIPLGLGIGALAAFSLALHISLPVSVLLAAVLSLGYDLSHPLLIGIITSLDGKRRGQAVSFGAFALFLGFGLGPIFFEIILKAGFGIALMVFALAEALLSVLAVRVFKNENIHITTRNNSMNMFTPFKVGDLMLSHRIVMAPLTRMRSEPGDIPGDLMVRYYEQRATQGGLIIAEATSVSKLGVAYAGAPGMYNDAQIAGWRRVTDAIHAKGGRIFLQLWHCGRQTHPDIIGETPVAPSAIQAQDSYASSRHGDVLCAVPRALTIKEISEIVEEFRAAAKRALLAGFDGVELHAANGYLPDQFLQDGSNHRTDQYGGSVENRARFTLEVINALISVWGNNRTAIRISPSGQFGDMKDSNPTMTFEYLVKQLDPLNLAYLHVVEPRIKGNEDLEVGAPTIAAKTLRRDYTGVLMAAGGFKRDTAEATLVSGDADVIAFGRHFISNPDLVERLRRNLPLSHYDRDTFYGGDEHGYTDYPSYNYLNAPIQEKLPNNKSISM